MNKHFSNFYSILKNSEYFYKFALKDFYFVIKIKRSLKMKNSKFFSLILFLYILAYFFRIDKELAVVQEHIQDPFQSYTEQPHVNKPLTSGINFNDYNEQEVSFTSEHKEASCETIWRSIFQSYNSYIVHQLKVYKSYPIPKKRRIFVLYKQNISHKTSNEEGVLFDS